MLRQTLAKILYRLYGIKRRTSRSLILWFVRKLEAGEFYSKTLRRIFADYHDIEIGMYSYGGCFNPCSIGRFTKIGRYCSFAEGVYVFNRNHPIYFKSMHPFFFNTSCGYAKDELVERNKLVIGNDVWVGQNVIILPSVKIIGDGAVIGAGAVVTKDVPDFAIIGGNPGKILKYRFSEEVIRQVKNSDWWDKDIEEIKQNLSEFLRPVEKAE